MIIRIVKLTFENDKVDDFIENFNDTKNGVISSKGCKRLELLRVKDQTNIFMTYSYWDSEESLEDYRKSDFFKNVWSTTKKWFSDKPQAWTVESMDILD